MLITLLVTVLIIPGSFLLIGLIIGLLLTLLSKLTGKNIHL